MDALQFYKQEHGDSLWLSKDAIIAMMTKFSDHKFDQFKGRKEQFNTERWIAEEALKRKDIFKNKG